MTINATEKARLNDPITTHHDKRCKEVENLDNGDWWPSAEIAAKALDVSPNMVRYVCNGRRNTCKGFHLSYRENVTKTREGYAKRTAELTDENAKLKAELEQYKADAEKWREQEAIRKAEEERIAREEEAKRKEEAKRLKILDDAREALAKANNRLERRKRMMERKENDYMHAISRYTETEREIHEIELKLLELEGIVATTETEEDENK